MMIKFFLLFVFAVIAVCLIINCVPLRPVVIVENNTGERIYIYAREGVYGVEPEPDEVDEIVKSKPVIIDAGKVLKIKFSFLSLIRHNVTLDVGWLAQNQYAYNATGGGGQNFVFSAEGGVCATTIIVRKGYNNIALKNNTDSLCLKKIIPFNYVYH